MVPLASSQ
jgi:hypothetical protein